MPTTILVLTSWNTMKLPIKSSQQGRTATEVSNTFFHVPFLSPCGMGTVHWPAGDQEPTPKGSCSTNTQGLKRFCWPRVTCYFDNPELRDARAQSKNCRTWRRARSSEHTPVVHPQPLQARICATTLCLQTSPTQLSFQHRLPSAYRNGSSYLTNLCLRKHVHQSSQEGSILGQKK